MAQTLQLKWPNDAYTVGAADVVDATGVAGMAGVAGTMDTAGQHAEARTSGVNTPEHVSPVFWQCYSISTLFDSQKLACRPLYGRCGMAGELP